MGLRSSAQTSTPYGLPGPSGMNLERVLKASCRYAFCCQVAAWCSLRDLLWLIENLSRSLLSSLKEVIALTALKDVLDVVYDACMHGGGERLKAQRLRANIPQLADLSVKFDGQREHLSVGFVR